MPSETRKQYQASCRGAAACILLSQTDLETEASELARIYNLEPTLVSSDINLIIQNERHQIGVFKFNSGNPERRSNDD